MFSAMISAKTYAEMFEPAADTARLAEIAHTVIGEIAAKTGGRLPCYAVPDGSALICVSAAAGRKLWRFSRSSASRPQLSEFTDEVAPHRAAFLLSGDHLDPEMRKAALRRLSCAGYACA